MKLGSTQNPFCVPALNGDQNDQQAHAMLDDVTAGTPHTDFMTADGIRHEIWRTEASSK